MGKSKWTQKDVDRVKNNGNLRTESRLLIGIDTGVNTGIAVWNRHERKLVMVKSLMIHQAMEYILTLDYFSTFILVEDARKATHGRNSATDKSKLQGAGSVKRDAKMWEDFLTDKAIPFEMIRPNRATTKLDAPTFRAITGWEEQTNQHGRDAAMIVFGK